jgi:hypothetical protein
MRLKNLRIEYRNFEEAALIADVESVKFGENTIWVNVPKEYESWLCASRYDGFLVALLYPAMAYGEDIEIDGTVSKRLLRNINKYVQDIFQAYNAKLRRISITSKETSSEIFKTATHIGTGFSGGVDSFSTIYNNFVKENDEEYKIDALFNFNAGQHGRYLGKLVGMDSGKVFQLRKDFLRQYTDSIGLPFISVDSNLHYYNGEWGNLHIDPIPLISGILTMQQSLKKYYIAFAGYNYDKWIDIATKRRGIGLAQFCEPYLMPLLSTESIELICDGLQHTRVQKTLQLTDYEPTKRFLNVCLANEPQKKNCGMCEKCARVGLTLLIVNKLDEYAEILDIEKIKKKEFYLWSMAFVTCNTDFFMSDIINFAKEKGYKTPPYFALYIYGIIRKILSKYLSKKLKAKLKKLLKIS